jgi:hypothetical protein
MRSTYAVERTPDDLANLNACRLSRERGERRPAFEHRLGDRRRALRGWSYIKTGSNRSSSAARDTRACLEVTAC